MTAYAGCTQASRRRHGGRKRDEAGRIRTWFPGRDSAVAAIAAPTSANRRGVGRTTARLSARPQPAKAAANRRRSKRVEEDSVARIEHECGCCYERGARPSERRPGPGSDRAGEQTGQQNLCPPAAGEIERPADHE